MNIHEIYKPFNVKNKYPDLDEQKVLEVLYSEKAGTVEHAISHVINKAILEHMDLDIDSTIMQMLSLNQYLSGLFVSNFKELMYNYMVKYLIEERKKEITDTMLQCIEDSLSKITMKTELETLIKQLNKM